MRIFVQTTMARRLAIAVAGQLLILTAAQADDSAATHAANYLRDQGTYVPGWDVALGGGPEVRPTYEGSDRYRHVPGLILNVNWTWADMISIGTNGISASWHEDSSSAAPTWSNSSTTRLAALSPSRARVSPQESGWGITFDGFGEHRSWI